MPTYSTYSAEVTVDGEALPEYGVRHSVIAEHHDMGRVVCWIPSEAKKVGDTSLSFTFHTMTDIRWIDIRDSPP